MFVVGLERTFRFFFQKHKLRATGAFLGGILVVLMGWPVVGMVVEIYGFVLLFRFVFHSKSKAQVLLIGSLLAQTVVNKGINDW